MIQEQKVQLDFGFAGSISMSKLNDPERGTRRSTMNYNQPTTKKLNYKIISFSKVSGNRPQTRTFGFDTMLILTHHQPKAKA